MKYGDLHEGASQVSGWDTAFAISVFVAAEILLMGYVSFQIFAG